MSESWPEFWTPTEVALYKLLLDSPLNDGWHIRDLLVELGLEDEFVKDDDLLVTLAATTACLNFVNAELETNRTIFPARVLRQNRYPLIRQMRDVHQFDVGSHLVYCHALAVRRGPLRVLRSSGNHALATLVEEALSEGHPAVASTSSIFHDFFKCFRRRRPLPAKIGPPALVVWRMPDGSLPDQDVSLNEENLATCLLPHFILDPDLCSQTQNAIQVSGEVGQVLYHLLAVDGDDEVRALVKSFWSERELDRDRLIGIYVGAVDWLGKGYAKHLITSRKKRRRSLDDVAKPFFLAGNEAASQ